MFDANEDYFRLEKDERVRKKEREEKGREGKRREGKRRKGNGREGKRRKEKGKEEKRRKGKGREEKGKERKGREEKRSRLYRRWAKNLQENSNEVVPETEQGRKANLRGEGSLRIRSAVVSSTRKPFG